MFKRSFFWVLYIFSFFASNQLIGQVYIADTLIAEIKKDSNLRFNHTLRVFDFRDENPYFISIYEKKKWLFFPVDQIVFSSQPIASSFESQLNTNKGDSYQLNIYEFYINHSESLFNRTLSLNGSFQLSRIELSGDTSLMGMFYYENSVQNKKKGAVESAYSEVLNSFKTDFISDLSAICSDTVKDLKPGKYHFRQGVGVAPKNFYTSCEAFYGYTFWGIDAEIWFSSAEPSKKFMRKSHIFRYLNYGNRQSVAFSSGASMLNYRLNSNWLFQNKSLLLLGFNKWIDVDVEKRTLEEIFLFQASITQKLSYNRLDKSGFIVGLGLIEEASYIIYNKPILSVGAVLSFAYKF